jgi:photosystem II stability/assembly factor-like uncharacterized protein
MKTKNSFLTFSFLLICFSILAQPTTFTPSGMGGGGYMYSPSISPHNSEDFFLVCDMSGVYRTDDGGESFSIFHYNSLVSKVKSKMQFTSDPNILYTVSQSNANQNTPLYVGYPFKSTDGGDTWNPITDPSSTGIHRIEADPNSTQRLLMNEYDRLFFSGDGGSSFTEVYLPSDGQMWLGGVVWDGNDIYVGTDKGLLVSHDGGAMFAYENFPGVPSGQGIFQVTGAKENGILRLFIVTASSSYLYAWVNLLDVDPGIESVYRLDYAPGASWENIKTGAMEFGHIRLVDCAKNNIHVLYAAGFDTNDFPAVFKSTDGGLSWINTFLWINNENIITGWGGYDGAFTLQWANVGLGIDVDDNDPEHVVITDGFSFRSTNGGDTWRALNVAPGFENPMGAPTPSQTYYKSSGLDVTTTHHLLWLSPSEMFAASTDVGNQFSNDAGESWSFGRNIFSIWGYVEEGTNNWYTILQHPVTSRLYGAISSINDIYLPYRITDDLDNETGLVVYSDDEGLNWDTLHNFGYPVVWLAQDQQNTDILFASVVHHTEGGIFRSEDGGSSWTKLTLPARTEGHPYTIRLLDDGGVVATFSARALADGVTLTASSGVFYSPDGGDTWFDRTASAMELYTKDITIDPADPNQDTWYASVWGQFTTFDGPNQGNGGLYKTTDRGLTWERIFTHERTESASIHPTSTNVMYVAVENDGLYYCENLQSATPTFQKLTAYPFPRPKRIFFNPHNLLEVWVTTMGGALWKGISDVPLAISDEFSDQDDTLDNDSKVSFYPSTVRRGEALTVVLERDFRGKMNWQLMDINGRVMDSGMVYLRDESAFEIIVPATLWEGFYLLEVTNFGNLNEVGKIIVH